MDYCDMSTDELFDLGMKETEEKILQSHFERKVKQKLKQDEADRQAKAESDAQLKRRFETLGEKMRSDELKKLENGGENV